MLISPRIWLCLVLLAFCACSASAVTVDPAQKAILYQIRAEMPLLETLSYKPWTNDSINSICNTFNLYGVAECNGTGWVTSLYFSVGYGLGPMATSLGDMAALTHLYAYFAFSGPMSPSIGNLTKLRSLEFSYNVALTGPIPDSWKALKQLETFQWTYADQAPNNIPDWIGDEWPKLTSFSWAQQSASGTFPSWLASRSNMRHIDLAYNNFHGEIPESLANMESLESLVLISNRFNGSLPSDWSGTPAMGRMDFSSNQFTGNLPTTIPSDVSYVGFEKNSFSGSIPESWLDSKVDFVDLSHNLLSGEFPWPSNPETSKLEYFLLSSNSGLTGTLPASLWHLPRLTDLYIDGTSITGPLPDNIRPDCSIHTFFASDAPIGGNIPSRLDWCTRLYYIHMSNCSLSGTLPSTITNATSLEQIYFDDNDLHGTLPDDWSHMDDISEVSLSGNRFSGQVPQSLLNKTDFNLDTLFLDDNQLDLCGNPEIKIPEFISCNVTGQHPRECGCPGVWTKCLENEMISICPSPSDTPEAPTPVSTGPTSDTFHSSSAVRPHVMMGIIAAINWIFFCIIF